MDIFKKIFNIKLLSFREIMDYIITKLGVFIPDKLYLQLKYKIRLGYKLNLASPQTFNEKLQWLKLYDRRPEYTTYVDKYAVREYIAKTIGEEYLIPLLGVWNTSDEIDFDKLPNQFVLKCNHDSNSLIICKDKSKLDIKEAKKKLNKGLKTDYYLAGREWPYKNVPRKIIAEKYMVDGHNDELTDYKFYCFNGEPKFLYVSQGLSNHETARISFMTLNWQFAPFRIADFASLEKLPSKPTHFDEMIDIARILSKSIQFVRVDLYEINNKIYFSELTLFPCNGFMIFIPKKYDLITGDLLKLPTKKITNLGL